MDALILAGGAAPDDLRDATGCDDRALIPLGEVPLLLRVLSALQNTSQIETIGVVGNEDALQLLRDDPQILTATAQGKMVDNLARGLEMLASSQVLVCTCDIPLVAPATFSRVLSECAARHLDIAYPIVTRAASEAAFPGGTRTYAKLRDGEFTGGNAVVVPRDIAGKVQPLIDAAYNARKNPMALAKMLGPIFIARFLAKKLSVRDVEEKVKSVLQCQVGAVRLENAEDATIAFDVDKVADWETAQRAVKS